MEVVKVGCYEATDAWWYVEEVEVKVDRLVGNRPIGVCKVQPTNVQV